MGDRSSTTTSTGLACKVLTFIVYEYVLSTLPPLLSVATVGFHSIEVRGSAPSARSNVSVSDWNVKKEFPTKLFSR